MKTPHMILLLAAAVLWAAGHARATDRAGSAAQHGGVAAQAQSGR